MDDAHADLRALVVDSGAGRGCLAAVRALARAGWTVGVASASRAGPPNLSRFARHRHLVPPARSGVGEYLRAVRNAVLQGHYSLVFACSDAEILPLSAERQSIAARVPYAGHEALVRAIDKRQLAKAARAAGLATPPQASSVAEAAERWGAGALVVKEVMHGALTSDGRVSHVAPMRFEDHAQADRRARQICAGGGAAIVQPAIAGRLMAFCSVVDRDGRMLGRVQQLAERTYPLGAGCSVRARTVAVDERLAERIGALLQTIGWLGLSELQFLKPPDGPPLLVDFNGRFYGSLALALAAGVNLPDRWARCALGLPVGPCADGRPGVRYHWLQGDLKASREASRGVLRDVRDCLRYATGARGAIWSVSDPLPGIRGAAEMLATGARSAARGLG